MCKTDGRNQPTDRIGSKQNSTATIVPTTGGLFHTRYPTESSILNKANVSFFFKVQLLIVSRPALGSTQPPIQ